VDDKGVIPAAGHPVGLPWSDSLTRPQGLLSDVPSGDFTDGEFAAVPPGPARISAEWALWGKEGHETGDHVLRCSNGALRLRDFSEVITRYSPGELDVFPQYTLGWIPGPNREPEYIALGIHEYAADDRSLRDAAGRLIVYVRLYCLRYADLAEHAVTYRDLVKAAERVPMPDDDLAPVTLTLPEAAKPRPRGFGRLADQVAMLLLTGQPVCVLGADDVPAAERLRFADSVMGLLPYGLRATMSVASWADSTSQDLKMRLFFSGNPQVSGQPQAAVVHWDQQHGTVEAAGEAVKRYQTWLKEHRSQAAVLLAEETRPVRFGAADLVRMMRNLPTDMTIPETLSHLGRSLQAEDREEVRKDVRRLDRYLAGGQVLTATFDWQRQVSDLHLLKDHEWLRGPLKGELYGALVELAFGIPLTYAGYRAVEECAGTPLPASLQAVLARSRAGNCLSLILMRQFTPGSRSDKLLSALRQEGFHPRVPLDELVGAVGAGMLAPVHGPALLDFALRYLGEDSDRAAEVLAALGYLARECEYIYGDNFEAKVWQLGRVLAIAFPGQLSRPDIEYIFTRSPYLPTVALEEAVARKTGKRNQQYVTDSVNAAIRRSQGFPQRAPAVQRQRPARRRRWFGLAWHSDPGTGDRPPPPAREARAVAREPAAAPPDATTLSMSGAALAVASRPAGPPRNRVLSRAGVWEHPWVAVSFSVAALAILVLATLAILRVLLLHG
jgi:hypothetical protein